MHLARKCCLRQTVHDRITFNQLKSACGKGTSRIVGGQSITSEIVSGRLIRLTSVCWNCSILASIKDALIEGLSKRSRQMSFLRRLAFPQREEWMKQVNVSAAADEARKNVECLRSTNQSFALRLHAQSTRKEKKRSFLWRCFSFSGDIKV